MTPVESQIEQLEAGMRGSCAGHGDETLYAFYDLEICTVTFDFFSFLLRAELFRKTRGFKRMLIVFVPGSHEGFRMMHLDGDASRWRMRNIHVPGCSLVGSVCGVVHCEDRAQARVIEEANQGAIFPPGYTTKIVDSQLANDVMIDAFMFSGLVAEFVKGAEIPVLTPNAGARAWVERWVTAHCGDRRPVVITLREARYDPLRNSNVSAWARFASELDREKYAPVIVRDTDGVFDPVPGVLKQHDICTAASLDVHIRMALYEVAHLNLLVNNGPLAFCYLNPKVRYLVFKHLTSGETQEGRATFAVYGIPLFGQTPLSTRAQHNAWKDDTYENITEEFTKLSAYIEAAEQNGRADALSVRRPLPVDEAFLSAVSMHSVGRVEPAAAIYEFLLSQEPHRADISGMLGLARHHQGQDAAARVLLSEAIEQDPENAINHFNLGIVLRSVGEMNAAVAVFKNALTRDTGMREAYENLGDIYRQSGNYKEAARNFGAALDLGSTDPMTLQALAVCMEELGEDMTAFSLYREIFRNEKRQAEELDKAINSARPLLENWHHDVHNHFVLPRNADAAMRRAS